MYRKTKEEGFTIIEVLIVLAIAGLIMLIVFLAVPALQRNSRNTQRRNDVATYLGAVSEFMSNNRGTVPSTVAHVTTINDLANTGLLTEPTAAPSAGAQGAFTDVNTFRLVTGARCNADGSTAAGSNRQVAVQFAVENSSGGAVSQCQDS